MNRWLWMASIAMVLTSTTGCLRHHTRDGCQPVGQPGACNSCNSCGVGHGGLLGRLVGGCGRKGCTPGPIGWQQGGLNYSSHLCPHGGTAGHPGPFAVGHRQPPEMGYGGPTGMGPGGHHTMGHGTGHYGRGHHGIGHGAMGGGLMPGHAAAQQLQSQPFTPGPASGAVAYPYYTHRGPRDFLLDNPPTIGR